MEALVYGEATRCVLLATYRRDVEQIARRKRWLRTRDEIVKEERRMCLVFVPYLHKMKELVEIDEDALLAEGEIPSGAFVRRPTFVSKALADEYEYEGRTIQYFYQQEIRDFWGYAFVAENSDFLAATIHGHSEVALEILYRQNPEWATLSLE